MTRRPNNTDRERLALSLDHDQVTATSTLNVYKVPTGRRFKVERVSYINETGLAEDTTNTFAGDLVNGATTVATLFATDSDLAGADNSLAAATWVEGTLSATVADLWVDAGESLALALTEGGVATLPPGRLVVEGFLY